jgi:hypothetical protein
MSCGDLRMAQPCLDSQQIQPGLQQGHCKGISKNMRRNMLATELRNSLGGGAYSASDDVRCAEAREPLSIRTDEERNVVMPSDPTFSQRSLQCLRARSSGKDTVLCLRSFPRSRACGCGRSNCRSAASTLRASKTRAPVRARKSSSTQSRPSREVC